MRRIYLAPMLFGLTLTTGCSVAGKWSLTTVEPEAARRDFQYASLTLQKDGSFYAESQKEGVRTMSGTYVYKDSTLTLKPHAGQGAPVAYAANMPDADHLRLEETQGGEKITTTFKRIE